MNAEHTQDAPVIENAPGMIGGNLVAGDWIDAIMGATIMGPYCQYPRNQHPRLFVVSWGKRK